MKQDFGNTFPGLSFGFFLENLGTVGGKQSERIHQGIFQMKKLDHRKWSQPMLPDCCWKFKKIYQKLNSRENHNLLYNK